MYLWLEDIDENLEGTFDTEGKGGGGSLKCDMDAVSVKFPGRFCRRYIPELSYTWGKQTVATPVCGGHIVKRALSFKEDNSLSLAEDEVILNFEDVMVEG